MEHALAATRRRCVGTLVAPAIRSRWVSPGPDYREHQRIPEAEDRAS